MKTLNENPLKQFPFSFHLAGATYRAIIYPAKLSGKVIQVGEVSADKSHNCFFCTTISFSTNQIKVMQKLLRITWRLSRLAVVS